MVLSLFDAGDLAMGNRNRNDLERDKSASEPDHEGNVNHLRSPRQDVKHTTFSNDRHFQALRVPAYKENSDDEGSTENSSVESSANEAPERIFDSDMDEDNLEGSLERSDTDVSKEILPDDIANISFGTLAKAQTTLGKRKRGSPHRGFIHHTCAENATSQSQTGDVNAEVLERRAGKKDARGFNRPSKHAPAEIPSKKTISRKRGVISIPKQEIRDPRFEALSGHLNTEKLKKDYAFLDTYRESEIAELKAALRKNQYPAARETLKRALTSMESRRKTQELKEQRQDILRRHRKEEREKVEKGKTPFYLKRGRIAERALKERFERMKGKQIEKVIERRRRKQTTKERREMPVERRM